MNDLIAGEWLIKHTTIPVSIRDNVYGSSYLKRVFINKFRIIGEDGVKYHFGGVDATEFSVSGTTELFPNSWYLNRIEYPSGHEVNLQYSRGSLTASIGYMKTSKSSSITTTLGSGRFAVQKYCSQASGGAGISYVKSYVFPVYLDKISLDNSELSFYRSITDELRYDKFDITDMNPLISSGIYLSLEDIGGYDGLGDNIIQWEKLDSIVLKNADGNRYKSITMTYNNVTDEKLKLLKVEEKSSLYAVKQLYEFEYYMNPGYASLSPYGRKEYDDWGFYNGHKSLNNGIDEIGNFYTRDVLKSIVYPNKGWVNYNYETNMYSQFFSSLGQGITNVVGDTYCGGVRVSSIDIYESELDNSPIVKNYYYVKGYSEGANPEALISSGILADVPLFNYGSNVSYDIYANNNKVVQLGAKIGIPAAFLDNLNPPGSGSLSYYHFSVNPIVPQAFSSGGSHVGYSEVIEKVSNQPGFKRYRYTNFGESPNNLHYDELGVSLVSSVPYLSLSRRTQERGKLLSSDIYDENSDPISSETFEYEVSDNQKFAKSVEDNFFMTSCEVPVSSATAYYNYLYDYRVKKKTTISRDELNNEFTTIKTFNYNDENQIIETVTDLGNSQELHIEEVIYPTDLSDLVNNSFSVSEFDDMISKNYLDRVISIDQYKEREGITQLIKSTAFEYYGEGKKFELSKTYQLDIDKNSILSVAPYRLSSVPFYQFIAESSDYILAGERSYDLNNNIVGSSTYLPKSESAYLWSYQETLPVASALNAENIHDVTTEIVYSQFTSGFQYGGASGFQKSVTIEVGQTGTVEFNFGIMEDPSKTYEADVNYTGIGLGSNWFYLSNEYGCNTNSHKIYNVSPGTYNITFTFTSTEPYFGVCANILFPGRTINITENISREIYYESFEETGGGTVDNNSHTGNKVKNTVSNTYTVNFDPPSAKDYLIDYWFKNSSSKWEYMREEYQGDGHLISGFATIDDIRVYPTDAQMTTYTYDPLLGMTSQTDANGVTIYYEYDDFSRLYQVKDQDGNVLSENEYNYKQ